MSNLESLLVGLVYMTKGYGAGEPESVGDGPASRLALAHFGFAWPEGSVIRKGGHTFEVGADSIRQLDQESGGN